MMYIYCVPVHADAAQVKYGHGGEVHVHRVPDVAHKAAEQPPAGHFERRVEAHGEYGDKHVGQRQRHDEVVGDDAQLAVPHHAHHHQQVAEQRGHHYEAHGRALDRVAKKPRVRRQTRQQPPAAAAATAAVHRHRRPHVARRGRRDAGRRHRGCRRHDRDRRCRRRRRGCRPVDRGRGHRLQQLRRHGAARAIGRRARSPATSSRRCAHHHRVSAADESATVAGATAANAAEVADVVCVQLHRRAVDRLKCKRKKEKLRHFGYTAAETVKNPLKF